MSSAITVPTSFFYPSSFASSDFILRFSHHRHCCCPNPCPINRFALRHSYTTRRVPKKVLLSSSENMGHPSPNEESQFIEAREAISEFLQEFDISADDSFLISLNSPRYVRMLMDGVRELDELALWESWNDYAQAGGEFGFKKKIISMAKQRGDNGKVAFLESIGLTLSSATNVARYLSSETLPALIHKVKYMKEMFFSGSDDERLIGKNARRMMMHLSISTDEDVQQTLSFFEKVAARRGGLNMLGSKDASFRYLLESFPRLLLLCVESHLKPLVGFLEDIGVPRGCMRNVLLLFPPIIFFNIGDIKTRLRALQKVGAVDKDVGKMLLKYPWILSTSLQKNYKEILSFFDIEKVPKESVERGIRSWPYLLGCSVSKLELMVKHIVELGVRNKKLGHVIATSPQLLVQKPQSFIQVVLFLEDLGFERESVGMLLGRCPEIFATSIEGTLKKKLEFLIDIGVSENQIPRAIRKYPEVLVSDIDRTLLPRIKYLMKLGLSKRDIGFMVQRFSPLLGYSIDEVLSPKLEFLLNTMEKSLRDVVVYPRYFSYSLEKKIKPRFYLLKGRNVECSLKDMLGKNDEEFAADFMSPLHQ